MSEENQVDDVKREAPCPYFGKCGGCTAQHIKYDVQLNNKQRQVQHLLRHYSTDEVEVFSDDEFWYRNRMDFSFHPEGLGFRKKGDWQTIIDIKECMISNTKLNEILAEVKEFFFTNNPNKLDVFDIHRKHGTFRYAVIRTPKEGSSVSFVLNQTSTKIDEAIQLITQFAEKTEVENIIITYVPHKTDTTISAEYYVLKGEDVLTERFEDHTFDFHVQGFFQNNSVMAEIMLNYVHERIKKYEPHGKHLVDLYGGVGTFGIINNKLFKSTTIVEDFEGSIQIAKRNIAKNEQKGITCVVKDAKFLKNVELPDKLIMITDPPRSGMNPKTIGTILDLEPEVIMYVSCNPKQMAGELKRLCTKYEIKKSALFDLFPQTNHMEVVLDLVLKVPEEDDFDGHEED